MYTRIIFLLFSFVAITSPCFAGDVTFGEAKTAISGADAKELKVEDLDGDSKPDLIWRDSSGNLKYSLQANSIPTNGLVAYYPFNGNANDESGNGNNGTVIGATLTADRHGRANKAYSFDGVNDYLSASGSNVWNFGTASFTISFWVNVKTEKSIDFLTNRSEANSSNNGNVWYIHWFPPTNNISFYAPLGSQGTEYIIIGVLDFLYF
ncbi:hypothetical protein WDW89_21250 [Deltaproteobacteria bacterium TL4]